MTTEHDVRHTAERSLIPPQYNACLCSASRHIPLHPWKPPCLAADGGNTDHERGDDCSKASGHWTQNTDRKPDQGYEKASYRAR